MRAKTMHYPALSHVLLFACVLALSGCGLFDKPAPKKSKQVAAVNTTQANRYVENLTLAHIVMEGSDSTAPAKPYIKVLNAIGAGNKTQKIVGIDVVVLEYKDSDKNNPRKIVAPVGGSKSQFASLQKIQNRYGAGQLQNISVASTNLTLPPPFKFSSDNVATLNEQLSAERDKILADTEPLAAYDNAKLQLQLVYFFMKNQQRDAAYLAMENVKDSLAFVAEKKPEKDIAELSKEAANAENQLHEALPYKL